MLQGILWSVVTLDLAQLALGLMLHHNMEDFGKQTYLCPGHFTTYHGDVE
jgi:hypothetical protein